MQTLLASPTTRVNSNVAGYVGQSDAYNLTISHTERMSDAKRLGRLIQSLRAEQGITQVDLSAAIGIARSTLAGIERGHYMPGRETLNALADFFRVPVDKLRHGTAPPAAPGFGQVIEDPDELALVRLWRTLTHDQRVLVCRMLAVPERQNAA
jgi:transcriptional regulator with XRE-family HTH domain